MWRLIAAYSLYILGFITLIFFRNYSGELISNPSFFWVLGIALFMGGYLLLRSPTGQTEPDKQTVLSDMIFDLWENGEKIEVDLNECEVKEHSYFEEREKPVSNRSSGLPGALLDFLGDDDPPLDASFDNMETVHVLQTVVIYYLTNKETGQSERFVSRVIPKDKVSVAFHLYEKKHTTLYIDRTDRSRYFFDLDFIKT